MKKLLSLMTLAIISASTLPVYVQAATTSGAFNVNVNLTAACKLGAITDLSFAYTGLQTAAQAATGGGFTLQCTNGLAAPTLGIVLGAVAGPGAASVTHLDATTNLTYTVNAPTVTAPDGTIKTYTLAGTMAGNQAGTCASSATPCSNSLGTDKGYTLYVTY